MVLQQYQVNYNNILNTFSYALLPLHPFPQLSWCTAVHLHLFPHLYDNVLKKDPACTVVFKGSDEKHHEVKIVLRFCIVTLILAALTILTLKIR